MRMVSHRTTWVIAGVTVLACAMASGAAAQAPASPTFSGDVAPILFESCVACHRAGEVAPMSLTTYAQVRPWARSIKKKVASREMPPWHAAVAESLPMRNDRSLDQAEIDTIVAWVDAGAPEGNKADLPLLPNFHEGWQHPSRPPDIIVPMPVEYEVPAEGMLEYINFFSKLPLEEDVYIEALEARPDNRAVVHHFAAGTRNFPQPPPPGPVMLGIDALNIPAPSPTAEPGPQRNGGGGGGAGIVYIPGAGFEQYPEGFGRRVPGGANAYASFQMHYTMTGKPETDRSSIGFWLRQGDVHTALRDSAGAAGTIVAEREEILWQPGRPAPLTYANIPNIPPFEEDFQTTMIVPFTEDATVYSFNPHAHVRGKSFDYRVVYPDGREQVMLTVPQYDFNWQLLYVLQEPLRVPAGSTIVVTATYDNSTRNRYNPAPEKEVWWADQSWEEMFVPFIEFAVPVERAGQTEN